MAAGSSGDAIRDDHASGLHQGPVRMCIGCRTREPVSKLVRLVADADAPGGCVVDHDRTKPGRGAHIHPRAECIEQAAKRRALTRALPRALDRALRSPSGLGFDITQVRAEILA